MQLRLNPIYGLLSARLTELGSGLLVPWQGHLWRFQAIEHPRPEEILLGRGAQLHGSRWNGRGTFPVVYGSTDEETALAEVKAAERYYGLTVRKPRLLVCIEVRLQCILDLTAPDALKRLGLRAKDLQDEDWRKVHDGGHESLSQCLGRAAKDFGAEGLLCRSSRVRGGLNLACFPTNRRPGSRMTVCEADLLRVQLRRKSR